MKIKNDMVKRKLKAILEDMKTTQEEYFEENKKIRRWTSENLDKCLALSSAITEMEEMLNVEH